MSEQAFTNTDVPEASNPYKDMEDYFDTLFDRCQRGFFDIRRISKTGDAKQEGISVEKPELTPFPEDKNVFVGVATRQTIKGGGKEAIEEIPAAWVDIDFSHIDRKEVEQKIHDFELKPSMVVESGNGFHLYWVLEKPLPKEDIPKIENLNKRLVLNFGGDEICAEAARILRVPTTFNHKYTPARLVTLKSFNDKTYEIDDFNFLPLPEPSTQASSGEVQDRALSFFDGVSEGSRHEATIALAGKLKRVGICKEDAEIILDKWNEKNIPPYPEEDLKRDIADIYSRYENTSLPGVNPPILQECKLIIESSVMSFHQLRGKRIPKQPLIIYPLLKKGESIMISAIRGIGKTWLALSLGYIATRQGTIGKWKTAKPVGCLYVDGEVSEEEMQDRIHQLEYSRQKEEAPFHLLSLDAMRCSDKKTPNLNDQDWRDGLSEYLKEHPEYELLILDNLASLTPGRDENKKRDWDDINQWLLKLRAKGISVIFVHHAGKSGEQRGTSAIEDNINFSIKLKRPEEYDKGDGAKFVVEFTKTRRLYGEDAKSVILNLKQGDNGFKWEVLEDEETKRKNRIIEMLKEGKLNQEEIAAEEDVKPSYVSQVKKRAIEGGDLDQKFMENIMKALKERNQWLKTKKKSKVQENEYVEIPCASEVKEN